LKRSLKDTLVGTWIQVSLDTVSVDGTRRPEKRNITPLTDSELKFNRPFVKGVTLEAVFKRAE
jgi:hypothetical protein